MRSSWCSHAQLCTCIHLSGSQEGKIRVWWNEVLNKDGWSWAWWLMPVIPTLERLREKDLCLLRKCQPKATKGGLEAEHSSLGALLRTTNSHCLGKSLLREQSWCVNISEFVPRSSHTVQSTVLCLDWPSAQAGSCIVGGGWTNRPISLWPAVLSPQLHLPLCAV